MIEIGPKRIRILGYLNGAQGGVGLVLAVAMINRGWSNGDVAQTVVLSVLFVAVGVIFVRNCEVAGDG